MFPLEEKIMEKMDLGKTAWILPHDNNSGGFYIAKIRKLKNDST